MKRKILPILLLLVLVVGGVFTYKYIKHTNDALPKTITDKETKKVKSTPIVPKYKPIPINGPTLWQQEAESLSSYPSDLDQISENVANFKRYDNKLYGYSFDFPADWIIDRHQVPFYTRLFNDNFRIDITVQNVQKAWTSPTGYISETLDSVTPYITSNKKWSRNSFQIQNVNYERPVIAGIENDMNYYSYYFITKGSNVYTFQLKSNAAEYQNRRLDLEKIINSFSTHSPINIDLNGKIKTEIQSNDLTLKHNKKSLSIPKNTFMMGLYTPASYDIDKLEASIQQKIGLQMFYKAINSAYDPYTKELVDKNRVPIITFLYQEENSKDNKEVVRNIINGQYDIQLKEWANQIRKTGAPVLVRLGNEMNGKWSEWSYINNYNDPDLYKLSFTHIVNVFKEAGASNAYFIWNPNHVSSPYYQWNEPAMYYPGDKVVDFVGMTSYNFGKSKWHGYETFEELYDEMYWEYSRSYYKKPLLIGEIGAVEEGGNKAEWITQMFNDLPTKYPNIKMVVWFDGVHPPFDLRVNTSPASLLAFQTGMNTQYVIKKIQPTK
ncbi:MAG: glycosyl hydrolase [Bacillus sp. (in: firmicutes)]